MLFFILSLLISLRSWHKTNYSIGCFILTTKDLNLMFKIQEFKKYISLLGFNLLLLKTEKKHITLNLCKLLISLKK